MVTILDADDRSLHNVTSDLGRPELLTVLGDVSAESDVARAFEEATERFGHVHGIFNNAAVASSPLELADTAVADLDQILRVDVRGPFLGTRQMIRAAKAGGIGARIVNSGSSLALVGCPTQGLYCAAKAAVISLTRTAAIEAAHLGVRVNAVLPGPIDTPLLRSQPEELLEHAAAVNPMGRFGQPGEVASLVVLR